MILTGREHQNMFRVDIAIAVARSSFERIGAYEVSAIRKCLNAITCLILVLLPRINMEN